jgi:hypothetical protein
MALADLLEQQLDLLGRRRGVGGFELMDGAIEERHGLDQLPDAGIGPRQVRLQGGDVGAGNRDAAVTHRTLLATRWCGKWQGSACDGMARSL